MNGLEQHRVTGAGGVRLSLRAGGRRGAPPIVFLHGWAQSARCWQHQLTDAALGERYRLVAADLRGHGLSEVPDPAAGGFDDAAVWAADLEAVLRWCAAEGPGAAPIVVGWSYGALMIIDYLRVHGGAALAGIVLVGGITEIGRGRPGGKVGATMRAAMPDALSSDETVATPALAAFVRGLVAGPTSDADFDLRLRESLAVPPAVRSALFARTADSAEVLEKLDIPVLIVHGTEDTVVDPSAAEYGAGKISGSRLRWMNGVGHMPFVESVAAFNADLLAFASAHGR